MDGMVLDESGKLAQARDAKIHELKSKAEEKHAKALAQQLGFPYINTHATPVDGAALTLRPLETQRAASAVIISRKGQTIILGTSNPNAAMYRALSASLQEEGFSVEPAIVSHSGLAHSWELYKKFAYLNTKISGEIAISNEDVAKLQESLTDVGQLSDVIEAMTPDDIGILVETLLAGAIRLSASDIHMEPLSSGETKIRYRLDGVLHDVGALTERIAQLLLERVKLLASLLLNVSDTGQDGRFTIHARERDIEIRASTLPGPYGEYLVLRLLDPESLIDIPELGMRPDLEKIIEAQLKRPNGMVLTTGPTGSGKTTMLYAFLKRVSKPELKIITIEDPIEYQLPGIEQTQIDHEAGYTFALGLKSIVRQDPDIILIGEIRDEETTGIALQAALTGHLVFSTLHTNDAAGAIPRLIDLGARAETIAPAINVVIAQRLVRRICPNCSESYTPDSELKNKLTEATSGMPKHLPISIANSSFRRPGSCVACHNTGYQGRVGIFELFLIDDAAEKAVTEHTSIADLREFALKQGMVTLQQDAILKALSEITSIEEIVRVTGPIRPPTEELLAADTP